MTEPTRDFIGGVSLVVFAAAGALHGLAIGSPGSVGSGLALLVFVIGCELFVSSGRIFNHPPSERTRRVLHRVLASFGSGWLKRLLVAIFALTVLDEGIQFVTSAVDGDYANCLYHGVRVAASAGLLFVVLTTPPFQPDVAPASAASDGV